MYSLLACIREQNRYRRQLSIRLFNINSLFRGSLNIHAAAIAEFSPQIVGISCYCWNLQHVRALVANLRLLLPEVVIVLGGPEVSFSSSRVLHEFRDVNVVVRGEGEVTFNELVGALFDQDIDLSHIRGITWRADDGTIRDNPDRPPISNLDNLPSPILSEVLDLTESDGEVAYETLRGCHYHCSYCLYNKGLTGVRRYSLPRIEAEMKILLKSPYVHLIWFLDPAFNVDESRAMAILRIVEKYNSAMPLAFELRAECLTDALIAQFGRLNVVDVGIGLQSCSDEINANIERRSNLTQATNNIQKLRNSIAATCRSMDIDLIFGLPGDSYRNYERSVDAVISMGGTVFYQPLRVFRGTELHRVASDFGLRYNPHPPYNVLSGTTYTLPDMISSYCLNVGIDFYNRGGVYREIIEKIVNFKGISYSELFRAAGQLFWRLQRWEIFRVSNWTPDDRSECDVLQDFEAFVSTWLACKDDLDLKSQVLSTLHAYRATLPVTPSADYRANYFELGL